MRELLNSERLFDMTKSIAAAIFADVGYPWEVLPEIGAFVVKLGQSLSEDEYERAGKDVWIARDAVIAPTASITGPAIIDHGAEIRHCAFIRGKAVIGKNCVVGNSVEVKNAILFDNAQVPALQLRGRQRARLPRAHMGAARGHVQRQERQVAGDGAPGRPCDRHQPAQVRRHAGRLCGDRLQQRALPRRGHRPGHHGVSHQLRARFRAGAQRPTRPRTRIVAKWDEAKKDEK